MLAKPVGPICNLDCKYCFYLEKEVLYPQESRWEMPSDVLETFIAQYIAEQGTEEIHFAWQGGEPTLLGVEFFRRVVALQARHGNGKRIQNAIQTNGVLLDDNWGEFLGLDTSSSWASPSMDPKRFTMPTGSTRVANLPSGELCAESIRCAVTRSHLIP